MNANYKNRLLKIPKPLPHPNLLGKVEVEV
jgi:hypothetical protein